jgi:hypothetical protein
MKKHRKRSRRKKTDPLRLVCWLVIPPATLAGFIIDALGFYQFTTESLMVIGVCLLVILLPFFGEIKIMNVSVKRNPSPEDKDAQ